MVEWIKDTDWWVEGGEEAIVYRSFYKGWNITVYPLKLLKKDALGWEYEISNEKTEKEYDSLYESSNSRVSTEYFGDHAKNSKQAQKWALKTIDEWNE